MTSERDPHTGEGGSYQVNKKTGRRELVERTLEDPAPAPASDSRPPAPPSAPNKEGAD